MNFKSLKGVLALFVAGTVLSAPGAGVVMSQNFDTGFTPGVLGGSKKFATGDYYVQDDSGSMCIVKDAASAPHALKVGRNGVVGFTTFRANKAIPAKSNFRVSFKVKLADKHAVAVWISGRGQEPVGGINLRGGEGPKAYDKSQRWCVSGIPSIPADQWVTVNADFNAAAQNYELSVVFPDGKTHYSLIEFPFLRKANVAEIRFLNSPPIGNYALIDDIVLETVDGKAGAAKESGLASGLVMDQNFDTDFQAGSLANGGRAKGVKWLVHADPDNYSIVSEQALSKPYSLKVMRDGFNGYFALRPTAKIPAQRNYEIEYSVYAPTTAGTVLFMHNSNGQVGAVLTKGQNELSGFNITSSWEKSGEMPVLPSDAWTKIKVKFYANLGYYTVSVTYPDGKTVEGTTQHPCLVKGPVDELRFVNILPQKTFVYVDDVKITCDDKISMDGRENYAEKATSTNAQFQEMLKGKSSFTVNASPVEMEFSPPVKMQAVVFAGKTLPGKVTIKALNAGGHWIPVGENMPIDPATGLVEFKELNQILKLQFTFKGAGELSSVGVYSPIATPQGELDRAWSGKLDAEYDLPVYDLQYEGCDTAKLTFVNHSKAPLKAKIVMHDRLKDKHFKTFAHTIPVGTSDLLIDLKPIPNGEYVTTISDASVDVGGKIIRLLRLCSSPENTAVPRKEMTGEKMFFPDGFFLADSNNIRYTTGVAKPHLVKRGTPDNDSWIVYGMGMGFDKNGKLAVNFRTMNRLWQTASTKYYNAVADPDNLDEWTITDNFVPVKSGINPLDGPPTALAKPDWNRKKGPDGKIKYRFYDPEKDGPIQLNQLQCEFINPAAPGTVGYTDYDWGVMRPEAAHVWAVWYKAPGEALIVGKKSLVSGFPGPGNIEPPNSGSDLGFGQWLSDDGKTLYFGFGRHLIRYMPYRAEYDNMPDRARIVGIWRTNDGINWEQAFVAPPDKTKPLADQHYGGRAMRLPNAAGLRIAVLCRYAAGTQQISWEIIYSWDGFRWTRFQREPQFLDNGPLGHWTHCGGYLSEYALIHNDKVYQMMLWINDHYHFQSEIVHGSVNSVDHMTAEYMKQRYSPRKLEKWPYFQKHFDGSWEKLSEHTRNATSSVGVMEYRVDGFFYATAGDQDARMLTHPVTAKKGLNLNAQIHDGGYIEINLLDKEGKVIPGFNKRLDSGDNVDFAIFDKLPEGEFQVELKLRNADVYTLKF